MSFLSTRRSGPSGSAPSSPSGAIENLSLSHRDGVLSKRHSIGPEITNNIIPVRSSGMLHELDKEDVMKAFFDVRKLIVSQFQGLTDEKELLDLCDVFRVGLCAVIGHKFGPDSDFIQRFGGVPAGIADLNSLQPLSLIDTQRKLTVTEDAGELHKLHMVEISNLTSHSLLLGVRATLDKYMEVAPNSTEDYQGLWAVILRKLFPAAYGYVVTEGYCEVWNIWLPYAQVVKRSLEAPEGKVLLVVLGQRQCRNDYFNPVVDRRLVCHLCQVAKHTFEQQGAYHPDRVFWLGFRGAEFGCGWGFDGCEPVRFWPAEGKTFQDVRSKTAASMLCEFAAMIVSSDPMYLATRNTNTM